MPSNFDFLKPAFPKLYAHAVEAERLAVTSPRACCFYTRFALEQAVLWLYENDPYLRLPYDTGLGALIHEQTFKNNLKPGLFPKIRAIHKKGNLAVHNASEVPEPEALQLVQELFHVLYWLCRYYAPNGKALPALQFDRSRIPQAAAAEPAISREQLQTLEQELSQADKKRRIEADRRQRTEAELETLKAQITALKQQNEALPDSHDYHEADTRRYLIDVLLQEAGWDIRSPNATEYPVQGMPNASGSGKVDYVLWGDDGKPLALVEAKRSTADPTQGKHQAKLYADCLEQQFNQRPVIFYTNGYETWIWDDRQYPPRAISGFLKKSELERLIFRRSHRQPPAQVPINEAIVNRSYQREALRRVTESLCDRKERKALLVMATGTGKTRTAIALVDLLKKANWVSRVLFLADRTALLTQAYRAFKTHLPTVTPLDLTQDKAADSANVVLSTYPTMYNAISRDGGQRVFGLGHFDLIIVDEAHRSIYQKYGFIFDYFDSLLVGLTATPRAEVDRDTYQIFELQQGVPTFAYELDDAVQDGYLVPPRGVSVPFKFLRTGVRYSDLSPEEQAEYEEKFRDAETGEIPDQVNAAALNQWLFNIDTVDQALKLLMERGLKVDSGDRLGKTIIFARNHAHAEFIVERFDHSYPHYRGQFAQVIDSQSAYAQSLLDDFAEAPKQPTLAVSVDMLDTGVDVPEVVNLVFFKPVYSRVKFNQMIGRGTRLCEHLFGPDQPKTHFLVFDLCSNFEYFSQNIPEASQPLPQSLTSRLVQHRLRLSQLLTGPAAAPDLRDALLDDLHQHVETMPRQNVLVRRHLQAVETFAQRDRWEELSEEDVSAIATHLASLPNGLPNENHLAKQFDLLCLQLQLAILEQSKAFIRLRDKLRDTLTQLEQKQDIPMVKAQLPLIQEAQAESWWENVTVGMVETLRVTLRHLVSFIDRQQQQIVYTHFADEMGRVAEVDVPTYQTGFSPYQYRKKVEAYIRDRENHVTIAKLKRNLPLTETDLDELETLLFTPEAAESRDRFEAVYGRDLSLKQFIRKLVGLDRQAAKQAFSTYLEASRFSANQIRFVETLIDYLTQNGTMDPGQLYDPPFTDLHSNGLSGVFANEEAGSIIAIVHSFNETVDAQYGVG
ncbi:DEAD/DEAH box helicase family protein [Romeria aff. gracilis LEGE 07310]|uniref:DEAD/DEAH box helicase family protein n=1 Tax=Vasconcelosia minhoensis LEGE 07310 TaxID=915328 RepID=A0A8J7AFC0_9CYAN|nr:DEAD/DEAH box helicase family protein [Romeria gracilis]MBE9078281.1 DEAD/DEAH box helicase family protein [Romeria aff. gracilis LEGE 07310]